MIYTVGLVTEYEPRLSAGAATKKGRTDSYDGGMVWRSVGEAQTYLVINDPTGTRAVYGVEADWEADTVQIANEPFRRLARDALLIRLP